MTKYEELCDAFRKSRIEGLEYHNRSVGFLARLLLAFQDYLGAKPDDVEFVPLHPRPDSKPNTTFTPMGAVELGKDGWWVAGIRVTIRQGKGVYPEAPLLFQFRVLSEADKFTVRLGDLGRAHIISNGADVMALQPIFEEAYELARGYFTAGLQRFIDNAVNAGVPRKIGFTAGLESPTREDA